VLQLLQEQGYVAADQIDAVVNSIRQEGETSLDILIQTGAVTEDDVLALIAAQFGLDYVHVNADAIDPTVADLVPGAVARKYGVVPVMAAEGSVTVALSDPMGYDTIDSLRYVLKTDVQAVIAPRSEVKAAMDKLYPEEFESIFGEDDPSIDVEEKKTGDDGSDAKDSDAPVIRLVSLLLTEAVKMRASDIHLEPMERHFRVRYRIDGVLREVERPPKRLQAAIISRIKIMSNLNIAEKRLPQDGGFKARIQGREIDFRVSVIPTGYGEAIVLRILDRQSINLSLQQLGMADEVLDNFTSLITRPHGIILVTGPTGSGKTTTLYAALHTIVSEEIKILTVEDPIEYYLEGINQVQVSEKIGLSFSRALRSFLRHDPDVILVGEIRDRETAEVAINASLTGHLVFSTLHTNDSSGANTRMLDMGVEPFLVSSSLEGILAQRLVRTTCKHCKEAYEPDYAALPPDLKLEPGQPLYRGRGCRECRHVGYKGRMGIYELLMMSEEIRELVVQRASSGRIQRAACQNGLRLLREDGWDKVRSGLTTPEEVLRVTKA